MIHTGQYLVGLNSLFLFIRQSSIHSLLPRIFYLSHKLLLTFESGTSPHSHRCWPGTVAEVDDVSEGALISLSAAQGTVSLVRGSGFSPTPAKWRHNIYKSLWLPHLPTSWANRWGILYIPRGVPSKGSHLNVYLPTMVQSAKTYGPFLHHGNSSSSKKWVPCKRKITEIMNWFLTCASGFQIINKMKLIKLVAPSPATWLL
jgi:hypothetical protein